MSDQPEISWQDVSCTGDVCSLADGSELIGAATDLLATGQCQDLGVGADGVQSLLCNEALTTSYLKYP